MQWRWAAAGYAAAVLIGALFALALGWSGEWKAGLQWERALLLDVPRSVPRAVDAFLLVVPWFGTNLTQFPIIVLVAAALARRGQRYVALHLVVVQLGSFTLTPILKALFARPRPELWEHRGQFAWAAYPSGHAIASIAVLFTVALLLHRHRGWRWPYALAAIILVVSLFSRLYLGVHWPTDVIGGILVGCVWLAATIMAFPPRPCLGHGE